MKSYAPQKFERFDKKVWYGVGSGKHSCPSIKRKKEGENYAGRKHYPPLIKEKVPLWYEYGETPPPLSRKDTPCPTGQTN